MIDTITIVVAASLLLLAILSVVTSPFLRSRKNYMEEDSETLDDSNNSFSNEEATQLPDISIIIPTHDNSYELGRNLSAFLSQQYPANFKVIVVADKGDIETEDLLKRMASPNLYATYLPVSSRYMSRKKLAITIGVKAAQTEWILVTDPYCKPTSDQWLASFAKQLNNKFTMGYVKMNEESSAYRRFEHIFTGHWIFNAALRGKAWHTNMSLVAFRKSEFIGQEGFRGNLQQLRGEYDFLVNKYGRDSEIALKPSTWLLQDELTDREWKNRHSYYQACRHLLQGATMPRLRLFFFHLLIHFSLLAPLAIGAIAGIMQNWIVLGAAVLALLISIIGHTLLASREVHRVDSEISTAAMYFYQLGLLWHSIRYRIHYFMADKNDFTSHKL